MTEETSVETTPDALTVSKDSVQVFSAQPDPEPQKPAQESVSEEAPEEAGEQELVSGDDAPQEEPEGEKKPKGVQKRIDELTSNWRTAERDRDHWRDLAMRNQTAPQQAPQPQTAPADQGPAKPDPKQFRDGDMDPGYYEALAEWKAETKVGQLMEKQTRESQERQQTEAFQRKMQEFSQKLATAGEDGLKVQALGQDPYAPVTPTIRDVALASENGVKVLAHLNDNRAELQRIAALPDAMQAYELAKLETRLIAERARVTKAPNPMPSVSGKGSVAPNKDPAKMSQSEYEAWRSSKAAERNSSGW